MRLLRRSTCLLTVTLGMNSARAQTPGGDHDARVRQWITSAWDAAATPPKLNGGLVVRLERHYAPDAAGLEQLRAEVEGKPEHPKKGLLAEYDQRAAGKWTTLRYVYFSENNDRWRVGQQYADLPWHDTGVNRNLLWRLRATDLELRERVDRGWQTEGLATMNGVAHVFSRVLDGGFWAAARGWSKITGIEVHGDQWIVHAAPDGEGSDPAYEFVFTGHWDEAAGRGFCDAKKTIDRDTDHTHVDGFSKSVKISGWKKDDVLGVWAADKAESYFDDGTLDEVVVREASIPMPPGGMDQVLARPKPGSTDVVRGTLLFKTIRDQRGKSVREAQDGKETKVGEIPKEMQQKNERIVGAPPPPPATSGWRKWGWAALGACIAGLVFVRWRRTHAT